MLLKDYDGKEYYTTEDGVNWDEITEEKLRNRIELRGDAPQWTASSEQNAYYESIDWIWQARHGSA